MEISTNRSKDLLNVLEERIAILDGAMGTMVHALGLDEQGFRGELFREHDCDLKNCIDVLTLSQPDAIRNIHASFLDAGADNKTIAKQMRRVQRAVARDLKAESKRAKRLARSDAPRDSS